MPISRFSLAVASIAILVGAMLSGRTMWRPAILPSDSQASERVDVSWPAHRPGDWEPFASHLRDTSSRPTPSETERRSGSIRRVGHSEDDWDEDHDDSDRLRSDRIEGLFRSRPQEDNRTSSRQPRALRRQDHAPNRVSPSDLRAQLQNLTTLDDWYEEPRQLTQQMLARRQRIQQVLAFYYQRPLNTRDDSPWSIMHHMLAWGVDGYVTVDGPKGRRASAIGWLCANGPCNGERMFSVDNGRLTARMGNGLQGHEGQMLALLAQARVAEDQEILFDSYQFTVRDLMDTEQATCRTRMELTFKLMGLVHYRHTDSEWMDDQGNMWNFPRLMEEEIRAPINGVTCGGTHRLMALSYSVRRRRRDGFPIDGTWEKARRHVASYQQLAFRLQNRDGSLSSDFFRKQGSWGDPNRKLKTTGHILEWLVFSVPHEQLQDPRLTRAVDYLCNLLIQNRYYQWGKGPLGHGVRALSLYEERVFGTRPGHRSYEMASGGGFQRK